MLWKIVKALIINVLKAEFFIIVIFYKLIQMTIGVLLIKLCNTTIKNNLYEDFKIKWETDCITSCQVEKK